MKNSKLLYVAAAGAMFIFTTCNFHEKTTDIPITCSSKKACEDLRQGIALSGQNDFQEARNMFIKAIQEDDKLALAYAFKSTTDEPAKEQAEDIKKANENLDGVSDYERLYSAYVSTYITGNWNKRFEITDKIEDEYPTFARAQVDLGNTYSEGTQVLIARKYYEKAIGLNPKWVGGYMSLANSYLLHSPKDFKKAEDNALKAANLVPSSSGIEVVLGDCYKAQNDLTRAREVFTKAITLDSNVSEPFFKKGHVNALLGNYDEARQNYEEGSKHDYDKSDAPRFIAYTYLYEGDYKTAITMLVEEVTKIDESRVPSIEKDDEKMDVLTDCANIAFHNNDIERLNKIVIEMQPISEKIGDDLGTDQGKLIQKCNMMHWDALIFAMKGQYDQAIDQAKKIKSTLSSISEPTILNDYEFTFGFISMKQHNYAEAIIRFEKTLQSNIYNRYWLAMANLAADNKERAKSILTKIANYNFNDVGYALVRKEVKDKLATL